MRAYSLDLRTRILSALDAGQPVAVVAERFAVSGRTVRRYRQQWQQRGSLQERTSPGPTPVDRARPGSRPGRPGSRPAGRHAGAALPALVRADRSAAEHGGHVPQPATAPADA